MTKKLTVILLAALCCLQAPAQIAQTEQSVQNKQQVNIARLYKDIEFSAGVMIPVKGNLGSFAMYQLTYGHYYNNGLGFKVGAQYIPEMCDNENIIGVPIAFAYRSQLSGYKDALLNGMENMVGTAVFNPQDITDDPRGLLTSFISGLVSRSEFFVGVTPDFIMGEKDWPQAHRFGLTADLGLRLSWRIWRFCLNFTPAFHYRVTNNHGICTSTGFNSSPSFEPSRGFVSFQGGLSFML